MNPKKNNTTYEDRLCHCKGCECYSCIGAADKESQPGCMNCVTCIRGENKMPKGECSRTGVINGDN